MRFQAIQAYTLSLWLPPFFPPSHLLTCSLTHTYSSMKNTANTGILSAIFSIKLNKTKLISLQLKGNVVYPPT